VRRHIPMPATTTTRAPPTLSCDPAPVYSAVGGAVLEGLDPEGTVYMVELVRLGDPVPVGTPA